MVVEWTLELLTPDKAEIFGSWITQNVINAYNQRLVIEDISNKISVTKAQKAGYVEEAEYYSDPKNAEEMAETFKKMPDYVSSRMKRVRERLTEYDFSISVLSQELAIEKAKYEELKALCF